LDEIGDMPLAAQAKVLRALQEHKITRVGGEKEISIDVRIVAATNKDLVKEIDSNHFRLDLYHRLSVIILHVPSLNDRSGDIPAIANQFLLSICDDYNIPKKTFAKGSLELLKAYNWTGNIRELRNVVERLVILAGQDITEEDILTYAYPHGLGLTGGGQKNPDIIEMNIAEFDDFQAFKDHTERLFIERQLKHNHWNVAKTAEIIGIQRSHLYNKIEKFQLKREDA